MGQEKWMEKYQDRKLGEMHLPGSHDAGTTKKYIDKTIFGTDSNAATQNKTIAEQLVTGTRFFDLRLASHNKQVVAHHTTAKQGAYSKTSVDDVLAAAAEFCRKNTKEVVIFRISHTKDKTKAHEIAKASAAGVLHTGTGNLCTKTLGEIVSQGGGLVCIFDEEEFGSVIDQKQGIHGYTKFKGRANDRGISTCGCYTGTHELHQVVTNGLKGQYEHNEKHGDHKHEHLWQVYWQKTYLNPLSTTGIEKGATKKAVYRPSDKKVHGGTHEATNYLLNRMQGLGGVGGEDFEVQKKAYDQKKIGVWKLKIGVGKKTLVQDQVMFSTLAVRNYALPNIVSYDFVNEETNKKIIALNDKGLQAT